MGCKKRHSKLIFKGYANLNNLILFKNTIKTRLEIRTYRYFSKSGGSVSFNKPNLDTLKLLSVGDS